MSDPATPTEQPDEHTPAPEEETIETGAWIEDKPPAPVETPDPVTE